VFGWMEPHGLGLFFFLFFSFSIFNFPVNPSSTTQLHRIQPRTRGNYGAPYTRFTCTFLSSFGSLLLCEHSPVAAEEEKKIAPICCAQRWPDNYPVCAYQSCEYPVLYFAIFCPTTPIRACTFFWSCDTSTARPEPPFIPLNSARIRTTTLSASTRFILSAWQTRVGELEGSRRERKLKKY